MRGQAAAVPSRNDVSGTRASQRQLLRMVCRSATSSPLGAKSRCPPCSSCHAISSPFGAESRSLSSGAAPRVARYRRPFGAESRSLRVEPAAAGCLRAISSPFGVESRSSAGPVSHLLPVYARYRCPIGACFAALGSSPRLLSVWHDIHTPWHGESKPAHRVARSPRPLSWRVAACGPCGAIS